MAISHIPRSVGHNFAPEYQISSVPYVIDLDGGNNVTTKKYIERDSDKLIVAETTPAGDAGNAVTSLGKILIEDLFVDVGDQTVGGLKGGFTVTDAVKQIELPKISRWIQFHPSGAGIDVKFGRTRSDSVLFKDSISYPLEIRCVNLYFGDNTVGKILVGLTSIDRSEFTEVVETFLEVI